MSDLTLQLLQDGHLHLEDLLRLARGFHLQGDLFPRDQILAFVDLAETAAADLFQDLPPLFDHVASLKQVLHGVVRNFGAVHFVRLAEKEDPQVTYCPGLLCLRGILQMRCDAGFFLATVES